MTHPNPITQWRSTTPRRRRLIATALTVAVLAPVWFAVDGRVASASRVAELAPQRVDVLKEVVARLRGATAVAEILRTNGGIDIVLWSRDAEPVGVLDTSEFAVLSFRTRLRALIWYEVDEALSPSQLRPPDSGEPAAPATGFSVDEWKLKPEVRATILATDLSDVTISPRHETDDGWAVLRIGLKWVKDRADGLDQGMADVAAVMLPRQSKESLQ